MREMQLDVMPRTREALIRSIEAQNRVRLRNLFGMSCSLVAALVGFAGIYSRGVRASVVTLMLLGGVVGLAVYALQWWSSQRLLIRTLDALEALERAEAEGRGISD